MNSITVLEANIRREHKVNWSFFLSIEKFLVEMHFDWINLQIISSKKSIIGRGKLIIGTTKYEVILSYSPFNGYRYDRVYIRSLPKSYHKSIHVYPDLSLCLYHPIIDNQTLRPIPLYRIIPWIKEWIIFYKQWEKYGVWLGHEIKH